jgi:hypothetical protein
MTYVTYAHLTPEGKIFYIGKGSEFRSTTKKNRNSKWHEIVNKFGGFKTEIMAHWNSEQEALDHERVLIDSLKYIGVDLVNITLGGQGVSGFKHTSETKKILRQKSLINGSSERAKALAIDPIMIEKRRLSSTGKKRSKESKLKMALAKKEISRPVVVCGHRFNSISELSKYLGVYKTTLRRWINAGQIQKIESIYHA